MEKQEGSETLRRREVASFNVKFLFTSFVRHKGDKLTHPQKFEEIAYGKKIVDNIKSGKHDLLLEWLDQK